MIFQDSPAGFRNVRGPLIQRLQAGLNAAGHSAGTPDGVWGAQTAAAVKAWQATKNQSPTGQVDAPAWAALTAETPPELLVRSLQLTADWEGTGYGGTNGNFDGQGLTWGILGFTWRNGEVQGILREIQATSSALFDAAFGPHAAEMRQVLGRSLVRQMDFARSISIGKGAQIAAVWRDGFRALGAAPEVQAIQNRHARERYWKTASGLADELGFESDPGLALCFDIAVQNTVTSAMKQEVHRRADGRPETDRMRALAEVVAEHARAEYRHDVLARKMTFVEGRGSIHGAHYDLSCWGLS